MAHDQHTNFAYSTVATAPSPATSGTSLVVAAGDGAKFPAVPFNATVWPLGVQPLTTNAEIVRVTAISTDTLTITRAQESSSARTVVVGDQIAATITAKTFTDIEGEMALLAGRSGGQILIGGTASGDDLTLQSTSHATKGTVFFGAAQTSMFDEVNGRLGINVTPSVPLQAQSTGSNTAWFQSSAAAGTGAGAGFYAMSINAPTASGHRLGFVAGGVNDSGTARLGPFIGYYAAEAWTLGSAHSGYIDLLTAPTGSASNVARLRIAADGSVQHPVGGIFGAVVGTALTNASVGLEVNSTTKAFLLPRMTTTQRDALTAVDGMLIYNTTTTTVQGRVAGVWTTL